MFALLDGDEAIFKAAVITNEDVDWDDPDADSVRTPGTLEQCKRALDSIVENWCNSVGADFEFREFSFVLSPGDRKLFRRGLDPTYKAGRSSKPEHFWALEGYAREVYPCIEYPGLEADDTMGVLTGPGKIIVSNDKDMKTVPGNLYVTGKRLKTVITPERANWWWMMQTLMGDSTDGFAGCTGCGPKGAEEVLADGLSWQNVVDRFTRNKTGKYSGLNQTEDDALMQAKLSRILRPNEYDPATGAVNYKVGPHRVEFNAHAIAR